MPSGVVSNGVCGLTQPRAHFRGGFATPVGLFARAFAAPSMPGQPFNVIGNKDLCGQGKKQVTELMSVKPFLKLFLSMKKDTVPNMIVDTCSLLHREVHRFVRLNAERQKYNILLPRLVLNELSRLARKKMKLKSNASYALSVLQGARIPRMKRTGKFAIADDEIVNYCRCSESAPRYVCTEDKKLRQRIEETNPGVHLLTASQLPHLWAATPSRAGCLMTVCRKSTK